MTTKIRGLETKEESQASARSPWTEWGTVKNEEGEKERRAPVEHWPTEEKRRVSNAERAALNNTTYPSTADTPTIAPRLAREPTLVAISKSEMRNGIPEDTAIQYNKLQIRQLMTYTQSSPMQTKNHDPVHEKPYPTLSTSVLSESYAATTSELGRAFSSSEMICVLWLSELACFAPNHAEMPQKFSFDAGGDVADADDPSGTLSPLCLLTSSGGSD